MKIYLLYKLKKEKMEESIIKGVRNISNKLKITSEYAIQYIERRGFKIANDKLRNLIEEINSCRFIEDKILIIKKEVSSLDDLVEILNNCIWDDEIKILIESIAKEGIGVLVYYLKNRTSENISNTRWKNNFMYYIE